MTVATCNASNCADGCCQGTLCVRPGNQSATQCGLGGSACAVCPVGNSCTAGACSPTVACDFFSCAGCCSNGACQPPSQQTPVSCGVNGATCTSCAAGATCTAGVCTGGSTCGPTTCNGCCNNGSCVQATSTSVASCGHSGNACVACGPGQVCSTGVCVPQPNPACIVITPNEVDFGTVQTGCRSAVTPFQLRNVCNFPVTVSALGIAGSGFSTSGLTTPSVVAANGTAAFTVTFAPTTVGRVDSILVVGATHSSSTFAYQTPVTGAGAATGLNQDRFPIPTKTDVVLIVDDSCSMSGYQAALGSNANAFLAYALSANVDFNLGVTTTDMDDVQRQGRFVGPVGQRVLRSNTPNLLTAFNQRVNVGTNGSGNEFMADPAVASLTPALLTTANVNFLRGDAALSVLAFTDAWDQSTSPVAEYLRRLTAVKGQRRRNQFSFSSVAPTMPSPSPGCAGYDNFSGSSTLLRDLAAGSGGTQTEICTVGNTQAWRTEATRLGQAVFGGRGTWFLTGRPTPATASSLTVTLNGVTVPELAGNLRNWTYDAARNAVVFEARSLPAPGQTVGVDYVVACMP